MKSKIDRFEYLTKMQFDNREDERKELKDYFKKLEGIKFDEIVKDLQKVNLLIEEGKNDEASELLSDVMVEISLLSPKKESQ